MRYPKEKQISIYYMCKLELMLILMISIDSSEQHFSTQASSLESSSHQQHLLNQDLILTTRKWTAQTTDYSASPSQSG